MKRIDELYRLIEDVTGHSPVLGVSGSGGGSKKGSGGSASTAPDTLFSTATVRIVDMLGEGEIVGVVGGLQGIYLNDIPVQNADGSYNFKGFSADFRVGAPDQSYMPGYPDVQNPQNIGVKVNQPTPVSASITEPAADRARVTIQLPALFLAKNDGSMSNNTVVYRIEARYNGGPWVNPIGDQTITGMTTSGYFRSHEINLPKNPNGTSAPWTVRVTRLSPDTDGFNNSQTKYTNQSDTVFYSLTTIIDAKFSYPHTAYVGITAQASSFGSTVPVRKYLVDGQELSVPSNYNPVSRTYTGIWDGTFKTAYSNNPAWALYLLLQNDRFGLGEYVDPSAIDKWSLYEIGRYCDQLVSDGKGGQEPRSTFNGVIETQQEAFELLQIVAQVFRGLVYWSSGSVTAAQDRPRDPMFLATESNVIDGLFTYSSSSYKARHTVAVVRFQDPDNLYKVDYEVVEDEAGIARYGYNPTRIDLLGCTSRGQAHRAGSWILLTELQQTQALNYKAGLDHATARPGDVVAVLDPSVVTLDASGNLGGRLLFGSTATILNLDHPVILDGSTYSASVQMIDGTIATADVVNGVGTYSQIQLKNPLAIVPDAGAVWELAGPTKPRLFSIISAHEAEPHIYDISLLQYEPSKYGAVDDGAKFEPTIFSQLGSKVDAPINLTVRESQYMELGQAKQALTLSWQPANPFNVTGYYVTAIRPSGAAINLSRTVSVSVDFVDVDPGDWIFLVTTVGLNGNASLPTQLTYTVKGWQGQDPTTVTNLQVLGGGSTFNGRSCTMTWTNVIPATVTPYPVVNVVRVYDISTSQQLHYEVLPAGVTQWTYTYDVNTNEGGPRRNFRVAVSARYASGSDGPPTSLAVSNPPPAKVAPRLSATSELFFVDITQPTDGDWTGYLLWYSTTQGFNPLTTEVSQDTNNNFSVVSGKPETTYYVRAAAYDAFSKNPAELNISDEYSVKLTSLPIDSTAPTIPGQPALTTAAETAADGTVTAVIRATWAASTGSNFGGVYSVGIAYPGGDFVFDRVNTEKWEMHGLPVNTTFQVKVRAEAANGLNASGYSPVSSILSAKSTTVPANPTGVTATGTYQGISVRWTPAPAKDITTVEVWSYDGQSTAASPPSGAVKVPVSALSGFYYDISAPVTGTRTYWLRSVSSSDVVAASYTTPVTATNPQIAAGQLGAGIIDATKLATSIAAPIVVATLPTTKIAQFVTLSSDGKLYRWDTTANNNSGAYVSSVDVTSIDASKITGQLTDSQIAAISAAKVSGQLTSDQIAAIAAAKISGQLVASQIASVTASVISGQLTDAQIVGLSAAKLAGQITTTQITDSAISTAKLAAGAVVASTVAAGAITGSKLTIGSGNIIFNAGGALLDKNGNALGCSATDNGNQNGGAYLLSGRLDNTLPGTYPFCLRPQNTSSTVAGSLSYLSFRGLDSAGNATQFFKVTSGLTYEVSAYVACYDCSSVFWIDGLTAAGALRRLGTYTGPASNGGSLVRLGGMLAIPSDITQVSINAGAYWTGGTNPHLFVSGLMMAGAAAGQTELSPWVNSGVTQIDGSNVRTGSIQALQIAARTITAGNLVAGTITATEIAARTITSDVIAVNTIQGGNIAGRTITAGNLVAGTITANEIAARTITATNVVAGTLTGNEIAANSVNADRLVANSITAGQIAAGAISTGQLAAGAITADKIGVGLGVGNLMWGSDGNLPQAALGGCGDPGVTGLTTLYFGPNRSGAGWQPPGMGSTELSATGNPTGGRLTGYLYFPKADGTFGQFIPVQSSTRYEATAYCSAHRCTGTVNVLFYASDQSYISEISSAASAYDNGVSGTLDKWMRIGAFFTTPANCAYVIFRMCANVTGANGPYLFSTGYYLGIATANQTQFSPWAPQSNTVISGGQVATNSLLAASIVAGSITSDRFTANTIDANILTLDTLKSRVINTGALTADNITVGNGNLTTVFGGSNTVKISGGALVANSVAATALYIGQRGIVFTNVEFYQERDPNTGSLTGNLNWTPGQVDFTDNQGVRRAYIIAGGSVSRGADGWQTVWWNILSPTVLQGNAGNNVSSILADSNTVLCATSADSTGVAVYFGGSRLDGTKLTVLSVQAAQIAAGAIQTQHMYANSINGDRIIAGTLIADKIASGTITANTIFIGNDRFYLQNYQGGRLIVRDDNGTNRVALGNLSVFGISDYSLAVWDAAGNLVLGPNGLRTASLNGAISSGQIGAGTGGNNLLANASFNLGTLGVTVGVNNGNYPVASAGIDIAGGNYSLNSGHTMTANMAGSPPYGSVLDMDFRGINGSNFSCVSGQRVEAYAYINSHRAYRQLFIVFLDGAGNLVSAPQTAEYGARNTTGSDLGGYDQIGLFAVAPAGAYQFFLKIRMNGSGQDNPYLFVTRPYLGYALPNQNEYSPWSSTGQSTMSAATASYYMAAATIGDAQVGTLSAGKISVGALSAFTANVGTVTAGMLQSGDGLMQVDLNNKRILIGQ